jgi:hypothetical protein
LIWNSTPSGEPPLSNRRANAPFRRHPGVAAPGHDEAAIAFESHRRHGLIGRDVVVDPEFDGQRRAAGIEATREDAVVVTVLAVALPRATKLPPLPMATDARCCAAVV